MRVRSVLKSIRNFLMRVVIIIAAIVVIIVMVVYGVLSWTKTFVIMRFGSQAMRARRQQLIDAREHNERVRYGDPGLGYDHNRDVRRYD
jgi:ABC-type protease/lipase transport system fused ATPase/permease subunit